MSTRRAALLAALALPMGAVSTVADAQGKRHFHQPRAHVGAHFGATVVAPRTHVVAPRHHLPRHHFGIPHRHGVVPHAHWSRPRTFVGLHVGVPVVPYYPVYYYDYAPSLIATAPVYAPPVYVERQAPLHDPTSYWYYCRDAEAYYPYVQQCASPWERVLPHAPPATPAD